MCSHLQISVNNVLSLERNCIKFYDLRGNKRYLPQISIEHWVESDLKEGVGVGRLIPVIMYCGTH